MGEEPNGAAVAPNGARKCDPRGWRHAILGVLALGAPVIRPELLSGEVGSRYIELILIVLGAYLGKKMLQSGTNGKE